MNVELAQKVLRKVRKYPERHNQDEFIAAGPEITVAAFKKTTCGTTGCIAGWAGVLSAPLGTTINPMKSTLVFPDGSSTDIEHYAIKQLDINFDQADALFYCFDNETAIKRLEYLTTNPVASGEDLRIDFPEPERDDL